jgi:hypothetical protein
MNVQRIVARAAVVFGGVIWGVAALASPYGNRTVSMLTSALNSFALIALTVVVFLLGMFYERLTGVLLLAGGVIVTVYGVVNGWESGEWLLMGAVLIGPMLLAGVLFLLAARMQNVCELSDTDLRGGSPAQTAG